MNPKGEPAIQQAIRRKPASSWASIFLDYVELKARLLTTESKEATGHLIGLVILTAVVLVLAIASVLMYGAFLLFVIALLFHLAWGWSALICGLILTLSSAITFFILRQRLRKPVFQMTLKDIEKDKEWLTQKKTKAP
ncbi:MAG: phage holin family protein [Chthoniobacterales bacterium]